MSALAISELYAGYSAGLDILRGIRLSAEAGQITAILGANGVGKSTLLRTVAGFLSPTKGYIELGGRDVVGVPPHRMIELGMVYVPQQRGIFGDMNVEENLLMGAWCYRRDRSRIRRALERNYERFPMLREKRWQKAAELSGGQQRMVEIARSLMADPRVILVDEPTAGLAKTIWHDVYGMLVDLRRDGRAVVLVDQEVREALKIADYVYVLDLGRNRSDGPPSNYEDVRKTLWI